ncbi:G-type lectin S-receptor-like serine/threonine-protein kinase At1g34300 [Diospyros lotus]|uniref:G-type lectin S-receptor-like serine/threonine-protein kinase At1g34300 n=1 Tax=Diospyros lotus TaxID=55363 RepID=UPI00225A0300|nr:G-type lectin S-receptor-like serine/threonine-protein kinase At1g34300 [Diospyros lotus]
MVYVNAPRVIPSRPSSHTKKSTLASSKPTAAHCRPSPPNPSPEKMSLSSLSLFFLLCLFSNPPLSSSQSTEITSFSAAESPWTAGSNQVLLSHNSVFAAGFRPGSTSENLYVFSVWYYNVSISIDVWSANGNSPVNGSAILAITPSGELRLSDSSSGPNLWPSKAVGNPNSTLVLGNDGKLSYATWSSFNIPTNTLLPNQTINGTILSSKNGKYKFVNSSVLVYNGTYRYWTTANQFQMLQEDGKVVQGNSQTLLSADFGDLRPRRLTLDENGNLIIYSFDRNLTKWSPVWTAVFEVCTIPGTCGPNFVCMVNETNNPSCVCPSGFRSVSGNGGEVCERKIPIRVPENSKFLQLDYVNYSSGSSYQKFSTVQNYSECEYRCLSNRECLGFGFKFDGSGFCQIHLEVLLNGYWSPGTEAAMFLRVDKSETDETSFKGMTSLMETTCPVRIALPIPPKDSNSTTRNIVIICVLFTAELVSGVFFIWAFLKKYIKYRDMARTLGLEFLPAGGPKRFSHAELKAATGNFSNIIGKGGFGDVYKGELSDHRVVAVKCLKNVTGGDAEFWAEVTIIARMHHLNLVRLWGFCAEKGQRILVYEYVPNGSLDKFLFTSDRVGSGGSDNGSDQVTNSGDKPVLDWNIRYRIALGVARAIAYLHEECLEWVLHCDIKPENILLGDDFCPKISDFGLAKLRKKEDMVSMSRIRGTRGYMAPEWVKMDPITPKADVYSFGMVLLEIVTGVRSFEIQGSRMDSEDWYLPRWAFEKVFKEMKVEDILDRRIKQSYDSRAHFDLVNRMVKTAMWCLQDRADARPSMGKVAKMLEGTVEITEPKRPTIFYLADD